MISLRLSAASCKMDWIALARSRWLLLGDAVEGAEAPDQMVAIDRDDFATGETTSDDVARLSIALLLLERRHEDRAVDDQKIRVARGHALPLKRERLRHWQRDDLELLPVRR